jgi:galactokinase
MTTLGERDRQAIARLGELASSSGLDVRGGRVRRTSSRFCLGVEHGDYNGTELFGVGTDRFIWLGYKPNDRGAVRLLSGNFVRDGVVEFRPGRVPEPRSPKIADTWARFPFGVEHVLRREGLALRRGADVVLWGDIPGGGMSRSASLCVNLILTFFELNDLDVEERFRIVELAQAVENDYIGSPSGLLDQTMILFARAGMGTHFDPETRRIEHVPLGEGAPEFRLVALDTGTERPGLEKSTYKVRRAECEELVQRSADAGFEITCLADVRDEAPCREILDRFRAEHPHLCDRLTYIFEAQRRFGEMLAAWRRGDVETVGRIFRTDGIGLRDLYRISGPELETMCDLARSVPGVLGERMLGGGDKGASGALVRADAVEELRRAVETGYPRSHPEQAERFAVHDLKVVDGVATFDGCL